MLRYGKELYLLVGEIMLGKVRKSFLSKLTTTRKMMLVSLFVVVPVLLIVILFNYIVNGPIKQQILDEYGTGVKNELIDLNEQIRQVEQHAYNLNYSLNGFSNLATIDKNKEFNDLNKVSNQLFLLENGNSMIERSFILVFSDNPYLINSAGTGSVGNVPNYLDFKMDDELEQQKWFFQDDGLYFLQSIASMNFENTVLVIKINQKQLLNIAYATHNDFHVAVSIDGNRISSKGFPTSIQLPTKEVAKSDIHYKNVEYRAIPYFAVHSGSVWSYVAIFSFNSTFGIISDISKMFIVICIVAIILCSLMMILYQRQVMKPFRRLIFDIGDNKEVVDEFTYLQDKWNELIQAQSSALIINKEHERENFISGLLQGRFSYFSEEEVRTKMKDLELIVDSSCIYRLLKLQLTEEIIVGESKIPDEDMQNFFLNNIFRDISSTYFEYVSVVADHKGSVIALVSMERDLNLEEVLYEIAGLINQLVGHYLSIIVSEPIDRFSELIKYQDELILTEGFLIKSLKNVIIYVESQSGMLSNRDFQHTLGLLTTKIQECFARGNVEEITVAVHEFNRFIFDGKVEQVFLLRSVQKLYEDVKNRIEKNHLSYETIVEEGVLLNKLKKVLRVKTMDNVLMEQLILPALTAIENVRGVGVSQKFDLILDYVDEKLIDPNLSLDQLSEKFEIDTSSLSRNFKSSTGMSYIDYVTKARIEKAKRLLLESNDTIASIATHVGYQPSYFNRVFKKRVGKTPGEFRNGI